jgi:hypothetical protein
MKLNIVQISELLARHNFFREGVRQNLLLRSSTNISTWSNSERLTNPHSSQCRNSLLIYPGLEQLSSLLEMIRLFKIAERPMYITTMPLIATYSQYQYTLLTAERCQLRWSQILLSAEPDAG